MLATSLKVWRRVGFQPQGDGDIALAFPIRGHRLPFEAARQHLPDRGVGEAQTVGHLLAEIHLHAIRILAPVAVHVQRSWSALEQFGDLISKMPQDVLVIAGKPDLDGRQLDRPLLQLAQEDAGFRSRLREPRAQLSDQLRA